MDNVRIAKRMLKIARALIADGEGDADKTMLENGVDKFVAVEEWLKQNGYSVCGAGFQYSKYENVTPKYENVTPKYQICHWVAVDNRKIYLAVYLVYKRRNIKLSIIEVRETQDMDEAVAEADRKAKETLNEIAGKLQ